MAALPIDHEAGDALAALSLPVEATPGGLSRRRFLAGLAATGALGRVGSVPAVAAARERPTTGPATAGGADTRLVVFLLGGGNDGLSAVQPVGPSPLDHLRPGLLSHPASLLPLGDGFGLHPSLGFLHGLWQLGWLSLVGGVGASGDLSHFGSMLDWMTAGPTASGGRLAGTGWVGRWLDEVDDRAEVPLRAVSMTSDVPLLLTGRTTAGVGLPATAGGLVGSDRSNPVVADLYDLIDRFDGLDHRAGPSMALAGSTASLATRLATTVGPLYQPPVAGSTHLSQAVMAARLLNDGELGCRVVLCTFGGFDHHVNLEPVQAGSLAEVDAAAAAFFAALAPDVADRTALLVLSEFGRRPAANGGAGADHGTASYAFLAGAAVRGGLVGEHVDVARLDIDGNPPTTLSHLDLVGSVLDGWLGGDAAQLLGTRTEDLRLFRG
jgi:uncharacterized protein (DUF1501 family)